MQPQYQQPQYPPQPYAYPPPSGPMPGAYPAQPAYPQQSYPSASQPAPVVTNMNSGDQFGGPAPVVNVVRPRIKDMPMGCLLLIRPAKIERGVPNNLGKPGDTQDRLTADVTILDGGPFAYGGAPERNKPHTHHHDGTRPFESLSMWINQTLIIAQCEREIPQSMGGTGSPTGGRMVLGRLAQGQASEAGRQPPWKLVDPTEDDRAIARAYLTNRTLAPPASAPAVVAQAPVPPMPYPQGPYGPPVPQAPVQPAPGTPVGQQPTLNPAAAYIGSPDPGAQYNPAPTGPQPGQPPVPWQAPAPQPPALDLNTPPPGMDPNLWQQFSPEQRAGILASAAAPTPWQ